MASTGRVLVYDLDSISLLDINKFIDNGARFKLESGLTQEEYDNIEEESNNNVRD